MFFKKSFSIFCSYRMRYEAMQNKSIEKGEKKEEKKDKCPRKKEE